MMCLVRALALASFFAALPMAASAQPTPSPSPATSEFNGQVLDCEKGYIVFTTGAALRLAPDASVVDDATGAPLDRAIATGDYAAVTLDETGAVTIVRVSADPIARGEPISQIPRQDVAQATAGYPNPDLMPPPGLIPVSKLSPLEAVTITVEVPPQTPFADAVYISTDTSGWNPVAVKMQRIDGKRFRVSMDVAPGTRFRFLFTRGSWSTVESDAAGLRRTPREFYAQGAVSLVVDATVIRWIDLP